MTGQPERERLILDEEDMVDLHWALYRAYGNEWHGWRKLELACGDQWPRIVELSRRRTMGTQSADVLLKLSYMQVAYDRARKALKILDSVIDVDAIANYKLAQIGEPLQAAVYQLEEGLRRA